MSILSRMMQESRRPPIACEITPYAVIAARRGEPGVLAATYPAELPTGTLTPGWREENVRNTTALSAALRQALGSVSAGSRAVTVVVPDSSVRVLTLDFDTLPEREKDALPIVRFRLRKMLPFDADTAAVSYQRFTENGTVKAIAAAMPQSVRAEYELAVRNAGFEPGALLPATLATLPLLQATGATLLMHVAGESVTIAIVSRETLLLHRVLELAADADEDIAQAIVVARAYFEDMLGASPDSIVATGHGSVERLQSVIERKFDGEAHIRVRPLITASNFQSGSAPRGDERELYGSVAGALS